VTDQRASTDQLDLFRQPAEPMRPLDPAEPLDGAVVRVPFRGQLTELPGSSFEDIFGDAA
jgi:hypothetical protein